MITVQSQQLLTVSEVFKGEILSGPEGTDSPSQEDDGAMWR
jgi:hypothetical protein